MANMNMRSIFHQWVFTEHGLSTPNRLQPKQLWLHSQTKPNSRNSEPSSKQELKSEPVERLYSESAVKAAGYANYEAFLHALNPPIYAGDERPIPNKAMKQRELPKDWQKPYFKCGSISYQMYLELRSSPTTRSLMISVKAERKKKGRQTEQTETHADNTRTPSPLFKIVRFALSTSPLKWMKLNTPRIALRAWKIPIRMLAFDESTRLFVKKNLRGDLLRVWVCAIPYVQNEWRV